MTGFTDEDLDEFRKEVGSEFYVPLNYQLFGRIANMPMWERVLFVWKHKKQHGCDKGSEQNQSLMIRRAEKTSLLSLTNGQNHSPSQEPKEERREG